MKKQIKNLLLIYTLLLLTATGFTQKVSNVHFEQIGKKIHIYYDLQGDDSFFIKVFCSQDKGKSWEGPLKEISGAIGDKQQKGINKTIIWDVLKEKEKLMGDLSFKIEVESSCIGININYGGQVYHSVQIGSQCWIKENLNVGKKINGKQDMKDNSIIEKYCYDNKKSNCNIYGGLYQWDEMMQYSAQEGTQGICPQGWHIPTDKEWKQMEAFIGMSQSQADDTGWRGTDEGKKMKSTNGWNINDNGTNSSGFNALPGGYRYYNGSFISLSRYGGWWLSAEGSGSGAWSRSLGYGSGQVYRGTPDKTTGFSVRCLKN